MLLWYSPWQPWFLASPQLYLNLAFSAAEAGLGQRVDVWDIFAPVLKFIFSDKWAKKSPFTAEHGLRNLPSSFF
jgi:hypothetical protein